MNEPIRLELTREEAAIAVAALAENIADLSALARLAPEADPTPRIKILLMVQRKLQRAIPHLFAGWPRCEHCGALRDSSRARHVSSAAYIEGR